MRKKIIGTLGLLVTVAAGFVFIEVALVGVVFLTMPHLPTNTSSCDAVRNIDGQWYCMGKMNRPDEDTSIVRGASEL